MTIEFIRSQLVKNTPRQQFIEYWIDQIKKFPHNEWFYPTNKQHEEFALCLWLFDIHLCEKKIIPLWEKESFTGNRIEFKINID